MERKPNIYHSGLLSFHAAMLSCVSETSVCVCQRLEQGRRVSPPSQLIGLELKHTLTGITSGTEEEIICFV